jgi:hypothetical protein
MVLSPLFLQGEKARDSKGFLLLLPYVTCYPFLVPLNPANSSVNSFFIKFSAMTSLVYCLPDTVETDTRKQAFK